MLNRLDVSVRTYLQSLVVVGEALIEPRRGGLLLLVRECFEGQPATVFRGVLQPAMNHHSRPLDETIFLVEEAARDRHASAGRQRRIRFDSDPVITQVNEPSRDDPYRAVFLPDPQLDFTGGLLALARAALRRIGLKRLMSLFLRGHGCRPKAADEGPQPHRRCTARVSIDRRCCEGQAD